MEDVIEIKVDYFLRYRSEIPADEVEAHDTFNTQCVCAPAWIFDPQDGWHHLTHQSLRK